MSAFSNVDPSSTISKGLSPYSYVQSRDKSLEDHLTIHLKEITRIGTALSVEKNIHKLLEMIVDEAKSLTNADAGTLYILDKDKKIIAKRITPEQAEQIIDNLIQIESKNNS
jgi:transcriptional regulator with GAF, ATPase, and Fis domain